MSKNNDGAGFEAIASMIVGVLLICWVASLVKKALHAFSLWLDANWSLLITIFWCGLGLVVVCGILYLTYEFVCQVVTHAIDTDKAIDEINAKLKELSERTSSLDTSLRGQIDEDRKLWRWIYAFDTFTGFKEHREMERKAKAAAQDVTRKPSEAADE